MPSPVPDPNNAPSMGKKEAKVRWLRRARHGRRHVVSCARESCTRSPVCSRERFAFTHKRERTRIALCSHTHARLKQEEFKLNKKEQKKYDKLITSAAWHDARKAPRGDETDPHHIEAEKLREEANKLIMKAKDEFMIGAR